MTFLKKGIAFSFLVCLVALSWGRKDDVDPLELRREIKQVQAKTKELRKKIAFTRQKTKDDQVAYQKHLTSVKKRNVRMVTERDSLSGLVKALEEERRKLAEEAETDDLQRTHFDGMSSSLKSRVLRHLNRTGDALANLKIFNIDKQKDALAFLSGELSSGVVDPVEALERYYQVIRQLEQEAQEVDFWQSEAPQGSGLQGKVSMMRMGFVWLACLSADASRGALWDQQEERWIEMKEGDVVKLQKAMETAAGKAAPQLVPLPFRNVLVVSSSVTDQSPVSSDLGKENGQ